MCECNNSVVCTHDVYEDLCLNRSLYSGKRNWGGVRQDQIWTRARPRIASGLKSKEWSHPHAFLLLLTGMYYNLWIWRAYPRQSHDQVSYCWEQDQTSLSRSSSCIPQMLLIVCSHTYKILFRMKAFRFITTVSLLALIKIVSAALVSDYVAEIFVSTLLILPNTIYSLTFQTEWTFFRHQQK